MSSKEYFNKRLILACFFLGLADHLEEYPCVNTKYAKLYRCRGRRLLEQMT